VDWFEATLKGYVVYPEEDAPPKIDYPGSVTLKLDPYGGTKHYQFKFRVYFGSDPDPFALLLTSPRVGGVLDPDLSQIHVQNHWLYRDGWTDKLKWLLKVMNVEINNVTRLDVAIDSPTAGFMRFFEAYERGAYIAKGRAVKVNKHFESGSERDTTGFDWGSKNSGRSMTAYKKSARLDVENKEYIKAWWIKNGLQLDMGEVERLELKMKREVLNRIADPETGEVGLSGGNLTRLEDGAFLAGIFKSQVKNWFEFVKPGGDKNISRKEVFSPINWKELEIIKMERLSSTKPPNEAWQAKRAISKTQKDFQDPEFVREFSRQFTDRFPNLGLMSDVVVKAFPDLLAHCQAQHSGVSEWLKKQAENGKFTKPRNRKRA
jgi:hypothetical protein